MTTGKQDADKNLFGGANPRGLYVPMTEDEQEVLHRLTEGELLELIVGGVGSIPISQFIVGDHRIGIQFQIQFPEGIEPYKLYFLDLELKTREGFTLAKERLPSLVGGKPISVFGGFSFGLQWDISIHALNPKLVKMYKPLHRGLTSRRQDKDTGQITEEGNMKCTPQQKKAIHTLKEGYEEIKKAKAETLKKVQEMSLSH